MAKLAAPLNVVGWFFPVEIDLTWAEASALEPLLAQPPRPLWISVYESANVGPEVLLQRLMKGYSSDVGMKAVLQFDKAACHEVEKSLPSSLSDVGIVGCKSTAAVYFSPFSYPISRYWDAKSAKTILAGADFRFRRPKSDRLLGLDIRAGLHTGEVETTGEKVSGLAVHIGARVMSHAGAGEVLVSSTVRDLVAGSDIGFEERGSHALRGVPGEWRLYRALAD